MRAILPGRPQSTRQAINTASWNGLRLVAYLSGNAVIIATGPNDLLQTIYVDTETSLHAVTIEESSGQIAVCGDKSVCIYKPIGKDEGVLTWIQGDQLKLEEDEVVTSLSWGSPEELMVGGSKLQLWYIEDDQGVIWTQHVPFPTAVAYFSHDGGLLASCGQHDRTVKIWRRLSYEVDSTRFDVSYLPHPTSVTNLHWRKPWHSEMNLDNLLYTFCADNRIRVWTYSDPHSLSIMQMVAEIDMTATIQPRRLSVGSMSRRRYAFIIDSRDFSSATEKAVQNTSSETDHALEHLIEVANRSPEICVVLDGLGHMSVWGLENAGCRNKELTEVFNIAHVDDMKVSIIQGAPKMQDYTQFCIFASNSAVLSLLVHSFDGAISWYEAHITHLFDTAPRKDRIRQIASWGGHHHPVNGIVRNENGDLICSWSDNELLVWEFTRLGVLRKVYSANCCRIRDVMFLGDELRVLDQDQLLRFGDLSDGEVGKKDQNSSSVTTAKKTTPKRLLNCNGVSGVICDDGEVVIPRRGEAFPKPSGFHILSPCSLSGWLTAVTASAPGHLSGLEYSKDQLRPVPLNISTNIQDASLVQAAASGKIALTATSRKELSIWDLRLGTCENEMTFNDTIENLYWHQTERGIHVLTVCFAFHVVLLGQARFTLLDENEAWIKLSDIRVRGFTGHAIGALCLLNDGSVVIAGGNQLFVLDTAAGEEDHPSNSTLVGLDLATSTLPVYHPEILNAILAIGDFKIVVQLLKLLHEKLKYFSEGDQLSSILDLTSDQIISVPDDIAASSSELNGVNGNHPNGHSILHDISDRLKQNAERHQITCLRSAAKSSLIRTIDIAVELESHRSSFDENALRYLHALYTSGNEADLPWMAIVFASLSSSQEPLVDLVTRFYGGKLSWETARRSGIFLWLSDLEALKVQMENVGRAEYTKNEDRNPVDCSLYYLALGKKSVLQGLWRTSIGVRERDNTLKLLANNFNDPKWKSTALKNAYALLSKRRFEYGAAFFLLGGNLKDAVNVCANQVKDLQLAVAIARVYDSPESEAILKDLIEKTTLTTAVDSDQGRWMAAWAYGMLGQAHKAVQVLVRPVHEVVDFPLPDFDGIPASLNWKVNDPLLAVLYVQLRTQLVKKNTWTKILKPGEERDFVLRCARFYSRMGADLLALRLVKNWTFIEENTPTASLPIRRGSLMGDSRRADDVKDTEDEGKAPKTKQPPPTQFVEPSADSLLDSFGF